MNNTRPTSKIKFCSAGVWRKVFLYTKTPIFKSSEKFIYSRSSIVPKIFSNDTVRIYTGKRWHTRYLTQWSVGYKFGEFTWNRKIALYKAKQLKKKK